MSAPRVPRRLVLLLAAFSLPTGALAQGVRISAPLPPGGQVLQSLFAPDGRHVLYVARGYEPESTSTLFSVDLRAGPRRVERLSHALFVPGRSPVDPGVRDDLLITPDSRRVVYRAQQDTVAQFELYSAPLDGSQPAQRISAPLFYNQLLWDIQLTPDGSRVVYGVGVIGMTSLHCVPVDGSSPEVQIADSFGPGIRAYRFTADDSVVFLGYEGNYGLYRTPLDGSQPALPLSVAATNGSITAFELSPDGVWAVYRADLPFSPGFRLFAVRVDGSQPPVALSGALVAGGNVEEFHANSTGTRVVYRADQELDDVYDLYSVPIDGSAGPTRLDLQQPFADVQPDFQISYDGLGVAYRSDQDTDEVFELYVVPLDGSFAPAKRSAALVAGGNVRDLQIGPGDVRIVYRADQDTNESFELYSTPIDGSSAPARLAGPLVANGDVRGPLGGYRITADGSRVVYLADALTDDAFELFSAPIDGSSSAKRESGALVSGGDVKSFQLSADGTRAIYLADQDLDERVELYLGPLVPLHEGSRSPPPGGSANRYL